MMPWCVFWFKKLVSQCFYPLPLSMLLLLAGCVCLWWLKRALVGKVLVSVAAGILLLSSLPPLPTGLLRSIERSVSPLQDIPAELREAESVAVVVLGGGALNANPAFPPTMYLSAGSWRRLLEGIRLHRQLPRSRLIVSLPGKASMADKERFVCEVADLCGLDRERIRIVGDALTTADEARLSRDLVGAAEPCLLVSDALHLRRAQLVFRDAGFRVTPAPSGYERPIDPNSGFSLLDVIPSSGNLGHTQSGVHEYLGYAWQRLTARSETH